MNELRAKAEVRKSILKAAIDLWGQERQTEKAVEEFGEAIAAIMRYKSAVISGDEKTAQEAYEAMKYEIADVKIMIAQLEMMYGEANAEEIFKLYRLNDRLNKLGVYPIGYDEDIE